MILLVLWLWLIYFSPWLEFTIFSRKEATHLKKEEEKEEGTLEKKLKEDNEN